MKNKLFTLFALFLMLTSTVVLPLQSYAGEVVTNNEQQEEAASGEVEEPSEVDTAASDEGEILDEPETKVLSTRLTPQTFSIESLVGNGISTPKIEYVRSATNTASLDGSTIKTNNVDRRLKVEVDIDDSFQIVDGDVFTFALPADFDYNYQYPPSGLPVQTPQGVVFGQLFLINDVMRLVFNDHFVGKIDRNFWFYLDVKYIADPQQTDPVTETFTIFGLPYELTIVPEATVHVEPTWEPGHNKRTLNTPRSGITGRIGWELRINNDASLNLSNVVITDTFGPGQTLVKNLIAGGNTIGNVTLGSDRPFLMEAWTPANPASGDFKNYCTNPTVTFNEASRTIEFKFDQIIEKQCYIYYETTVPSDGLPYTYTNAAKVEATGQAPSALTYSAKPYIAAGGNAGTPRYQIVIEKREGSATGPIITAQAKFRLSTLDGVVVGEKTTTNGEAVFDIYSGNAFVVEELSAPSGYILGAPKQIILDSPANNSVIRYQYVNLKAGTINLTKIDAETKSVIEDYTIFNVEKYETTGAGRTLISKTRYSTDDKGLLSLKDLGPGEYEITEFTPPTGYAKSQEKLTFTVTGDGAVLTDEFENEELRGAIVLNKIDPNLATNLAGVTFNIKGPNGYDETFVTDSNGLIRVDDLKLGDYVMEEIATLPGYKPSTVRHEFTIGEAADPNNPVGTQSGDKALLHRIIISNEQFAQTKILLTKEDADSGDKLSGVKFDLFVIEPGNIRTLVAGDLTTNSDGQIELAGFVGSPLIDASIKGPEYGSYVLVEKETLPNYKKNTNEIIFELTATNPTFTTTVKNEKYGSLMIKKVDASNNAVTLHGVTFKLEKLDASTNAYVEIAGLPLTDAQGEISVQALERGQYKLTEVATISGYVLNATPIEFEIGYNSQLETNISIPTVKALSHALTITNNKITETPTPTPEPGPTPTPTPNPSPEPGPTPTPTPEPTPEPIPAPNAGELPEELIERIDEIKDVVEKFPDRPPTIIERDKAKDLYEDYEVLDEPKKETFETLINVEKLKQVAEYNGPFLPQTNAVQTKLPLAVGTTFIIAALYYARRIRKTV